VSLNVDDRTKAATEWTAASGIEGMHPAEEAFEIIGRIFGQRRAYQRGPSTPVKWFGFVSHDVCQDLMPDPLGLSMKQYAPRSEFGALGRLI
jgi:hypothetical protein